MSESEKKRMKILAAVFGIAGAIWVIYGFCSPRFILYPLIGFANLGIAYLCKQNSV